MEINEIKKIIEALLFVSDKPLLTREIKAIIKEDLPQDIKLEDILAQMQEEYVQLNRAFELKFVADGWTFSTKPEYSLWIKKMLKEKTVLKLSPSAMEVLAIIAYKQPITRGEIDNIRGVDCGGVIDTLTDRKFIKIVGKKETLGRPMLYGTTQEFLRHFGLSHLSELPVIESADSVLPNHEEKVPELPFEHNDENNENAENTQQQSSENTTAENISVENTTTETTENQSFESPSQEIEVTEVSNNQSSQSQQEPTLNTIETTENSSEVQQVSDVIESVEQTQENTDSGQQNID